MSALTRSGGTLLIAIALLCGCTSSGFEEPAAGGSSAATSSSPSVAPGVGPHRQGDCVEIGGDAPAKVDCDRPHEYEVMLSDELPQQARTSYPPPVDTAARPACYASMSTYLGSSDVRASRLEPLALWPTEEQWGAGDRWFACVVVERSPENEPTKRTGRLAGALADGLGTFQRCLVGEPFDDPQRIVPCDQPHRSEAMPGVLVLGSHTDPMPSAGDMLKRLTSHCDSRIRDYLGGDRPGVFEAALAPQPTDWPTGLTSAVCYAVSDTPVTAPMGK